MSKVGASVGGVVGTAIGGPARTPISAVTGSIALGTYGAIRGGEIGSEIFGSVTKNITEVALGEDPISEILQDILEEALYGIHNVFN